MLCAFLKSLSSTEVLDWAEVIERIELETPQVVYMLRCRACGEHHSIDYGLMTSEEPAAFLSAAALLAADESPVHQHYQSVC